MLRCAQHDKRGLSMTKGEYSMTRGALMGAGQGMLCCSLRGVYPERSEWAQGKLREGAQDKAQHDTRGRLWANVRKILPVLAASAVDRHCEVIAP